MIGSWERAGNFYDKSAPFKECKLICKLIDAHSMGRLIPFLRKKGYSNIREVAYYKDVKISNRKPADIPTILGITLSQYYTNLIVVRIITSKSISEYVIRAIKKFFKDEQWTAYISNRKCIKDRYLNPKFKIFLIKLNPKLISKNIFEYFFTTLNEIIGQNEFSPQMMLEFKNIGSFLKNDSLARNNFIHFIQEERNNEWAFELFLHRIILVHNSFNIFLLDVSTGALLTLALELLSKGAINSNQRDEDGLSLIDYTWMVKLKDDRNNKYSNELFKIFLYYGAEIQSSLKSMIENGQHEKVKIFETAMFQLEKPIAKVKTSSLAPKRDHIATTLEFDDKTTIVSQLKRTEKLTKHELLQLFELTDICFPSSNQNEKEHLFKTLSQILAPNKDKLIELMYAQTRHNLKLIGFVIILALITDDCVYSDFPLAAVDPKYRKLKLMTYFVNRAGHARQLTTDKRVLNTADACTSAGFKVAPSKHFPKYQPRHFSEIMRKRVNLTYGNDAIYNHKKFVCHTVVKDPLSESKEHVAHRPDIRDDMFRRFQNFMDEEGCILDLSKIDPKIIASREVPIAWPANLETIKEIQESLWKDFNYLNHCIELSQLLPPLSNQKPKKPNINYLDYTLFGCFSHIKKPRPPATSWNFKHNKPSDPKHLPAGFIKAKL